MDILFAGNQTIQDVVEAYSNMLIKIAFQNVKNLADAEDIVQNVFIKLMEKNSSFHDASHLRAWLIRVTINKCKDHFRSSWFRKTTPLTTSMDFLAPKEQEIMSEIFSLDMKYRNVIYLYHYEGYSIKEIAAITGKKSTTVSSLLQRGRKKLKNLILKGDT